MRIFTGSRELPFAGHPTIGTTWVLANQGRLPVGRAELALEEQIGLVPVRLEGDLWAPSTIWMSHRPAEFGAPLGNRRRSPRDSVSRRTTCWTISPS